MEILFSATTSRTHTGWRVVTLVQGGMVSDYNQIIKHVLKFNRDKFGYSKSSFKTTLDHFRLVGVDIFDQSPMVEKPPLGPNEKSKLLIKVLPENKDKDLFILHIATEVLVTPGTRVSVAMASD